MIQKMICPGVVVGLAIAVSAAHAAPQIPSEFDAPGQALLRQFSYFGGVASFGVIEDTTPVYSGGSLNVWADFQHDPIFSIAGFGIGTGTVTGAALSVPAGADTFSITISAPPEGTLSLIVNVREDDNADGFIDVAGDDDEWETLAIFLDPGLHVYNFPASAFVPANEGTGNDIQEFDTTPAMSVTLTFETRATNPGGIIEVPVSFSIDHAGWYVGNQSLAPGADLNGDGIVDTADLGILLGAFGTNNPAADVNGDGVVDTADLGILLGVFGTPG
ncbi:MAG: hypothetical protein H6813_05250 [Phycisphaeraceae bacterium]|nr:hypothetical protein [Phycisphaeraceae bacterium]MCB9847790.1 hypothetical protein [Phycisphaeraceae bacterium]